MPAAIKVIFFDVDDTIYDHSFHIEEGIKYLWETHAFLQGYSVEFLKELSHKYLEEAHARLIKGELTIDEARRARWQKFLRYFGQEKNFDPIEFSSGYLKTYYNAERITPGAKELLDELKKDYRLGIISNNLLSEQLGKLQRLGISEYFDLFAISEEVGFAKPDKKIFDAALQRGGINADEAIYIGDVWEIDVLGALGAGIRPIWYNRRGLSLPDPKISQIQSFEPLEDTLDHILNDNATPKITSTDPAAA